MCQNQVDGLLHDTSLLHTTIRTEFHRFHLLSNQQFIESVRRAPLALSRPLRGSSRRFAAHPAPDGHDGHVPPLPPDPPQRVYDEDVEALRPQPKAAAAAPAPEARGPSPSTPSRRLSPPPPLFTR